MQGLPLPVATAYALSIAFGIIGVIHFSGVGIIRRTYVRWGYSPQHCRIVGALQIMAAVLLITAPTRPIGISLVAVVNFISVVLLLKNRAYIFAILGVAVAAVLPLTLIPVH